MDDTSLSTSPNAEHAPAPEGSRVERRRHAREILSTQHSRLDRLESELTDRLQQVADEIAREFSATHGGQVEAAAEAAHEARVASLTQQVERMRQELAERQEALAGATNELDQTRVDAAGVEQELRVHEALLAEANRRDERQRVELAAVVEQLSEAQTQLAVARERQEDARRESAAVAERFAAEQEKANSDRRRVARGFKARHAAQVTQIDQQQAELARLREQLAEKEAEQSRLVAELHDASTPGGADLEELHNLRRERDGLAQRLATATEQLSERERAGADQEKARLDVGRLEQELRVRDALLAEAQSRQEKHQVESVAASQELADAKARLAAADERLAEFDRMAAHVQQARIESGRLEQELRVRESQLADTQAREERNRAELAAAVEQLRDTQAELVAVRERQGEMREDAAELAARDAEIARLRESLTAEQTERERLANEVRKHADRGTADSAEFDKLRRERDGLAQQSAALEARLADAVRDATELEQARIATCRLEQDLRIRESMLAEAHGRDAKSRAELATSQQQLADLERQLTAAGQRSHEAQRNASQLEQARLEVARAERELRLRDTLLSEAQGQAEKTRVELATAVEQLKNTQAQLAAAREVQDDLRRQVAASQRAESTELESQTSALREMLAAAQAENKRLAEQARQAATSDSDVSEELAELRDERDHLAGERDKLTKRLAAAEAQLCERPEASDPEDNEEISRRFEMAVEDLREQKRINAELEAKLKKSGSSAAISAGIGGGMDWESQRKRCMASLEEDDRDDETAVAERQTIEGTIHITDQIVGQKDQEIAGLKRLLEEQSSSGGTSASASAVAELLDHDEVIRQEREKLQQAQAEWREKIGKAEIDISVERAKIARERMEVEEKMRAYQNDQATRPSEGAPPTQEKPDRGRWLSRLGLKNLNDE